MQTDTPEIPASQPATEGLTPAEPAAAIPAAPEAAALLLPGDVLGAVAEPGRLAIVRWLADGTPRSVNAIAVRLGLAPDTVSKHLRVLREARVLIPVASPDGDGRKQFYQVPALFRRQDAAGRPLLDFGIALLRF